MASIRPVPSGTSLSTTLTVQPFTGYPLTLENVGWSLGKMWKWS